MTTPRIEPIIRTLESARRRSVIEVRYTRGEGVEGDPVRTIVAYYSDDGTFLAEYDDWAVRPRTRLSKEPGRGDSGPAG